MSGLLFTCNNSNRGLALLQLYVSLGAGIIPNTRNSTRATPAKFMAVILMNSKTSFFLGCFFQVNKGMYDSAKTLASKDQAKGFPVARPVSKRKGRWFSALFVAVFALFSRIPSALYAGLQVCTAVDFLELTLETPDHTPVSSAWAPSRPSPVHAARIVPRAITDLPDLCSATVSWRALGYNLKVCVMAAVFFGD